MNNFSKQELKFTYNNNSVVLWIEKAQNILDIQDTLRALLNIPNNEQIDLCVGKYFLNEFFHKISFGKITECFFTNKFEIVLSRDNLMNFRDIQSISSRMRNLEYKKLEKECEDNLIRLKSLIEHEGKLKKDLTQLSSFYSTMVNKAKMLKIDEPNDNFAIKLDEEDDEVRDLKHRIQMEKAKTENVESFLERNFEKIINYKNIEKEALYYFKENKRIIGNINSNYQLIEEMNEGNKKLEFKKQAIIQSKELSQKMVKRILNVDKNVSLDEIKLKYIRFYKHKAIIELINFREVALYYPKNDSENLSNLYNQGEIVLREFKDNCDFGYIYNSQIKRDQFSLNVKDKLVIVIKKHIFFYDLETNIMNFNTFLEEDHKGGSLVYVPYDNLIYCISGINTNAVETINIFDEEENDTKKSQNALTEPRAYFTTYVQNDSKIFVLLGYNYLKNDFMTTIEKLDTASYDKSWKELYFYNERSVPKLVFTSCIPSSNDKIHILGGVDENYTLNKMIYVCCLSPSLFEIESSNMALPFDDDTKGVTLARDSRNGFQFIFYQENCFIPLSTPVEDNDAFLFGLFDSKHNLHLTNLSNFNYSIMALKEEKNKNIKNAMAVGNVYNNNNFKDAITNKGNKNIINNFNKNINNNCSNYYLGHLNSKNKNNNQAGYDNEDDENITQFNNPNILNTKH